MASGKRIMIAISGASGTAYARRLLDTLPNTYDTVYLTASDNALEIMKHEIGANELADLIPPEHASKFTLLDSNDLFSPPASGSHDYDGLVVIPCSMGLIGRIASGVSNDLVTRAADVCLKERRNLVLVARETPLNVIHLRNMTTLAESGAVILPACPAFYQRPESIEDIIDFVVDRVLRALGSNVRLTKGWGE